MRTGWRRVIGRVVRVPEPVAVPEVVARRPAPVQRRDLVVEVRVRPLGDDA